MQEYHPNNAQRPEPGLKAVDTVRPHVKGLMKFTRMVYCGSYGQEKTTSGQQLTSGED